VSDVYRPIVIIDDDPTGTQTTIDFPVLTRWTSERITSLFTQRESAIFFLANTRAMDADRARSIVSEIVQKTATAARATKASPVFVCRSDSTLRSHFPVELETVRAVWHSSTGERLGPAVFLPAFFEGRRITRNGIHGILDDDRFVPLHETEFSRDPEFPYESAQLHEYVRAKTDSKGVSLRPRPWGDADPDGVWTTDVEQYDGPGGLDETVADLRRRLDSGEPLIFQTAASFIRSWTGQSGWDITASPQRSGMGPGIVIVGSFVDLSSRQLERLLTDPSVRGLEIAIDRLLQSPATEVARNAAAIERIAAAGFTPVAYTTRGVRTDAGNHRAVGTQVAKALVEIVRATEFVPSFVLAKGGITSHTILRDGLNVSEGRVSGAIIPGVPVIRIQHPKRTEAEMDYVIFPGNVGTPESLLEVYQRYSGRSNT